MKLWRYGQPIEVLGQRYRLEGMLGSGGMAEVCLAWDERERCPVAIKVLKTDEMDQQLINRFVKEAGQVVGWQHPHILRIYEHTQVEVLENADKDAVIFYIVMEYASGGDLQKRMRSGDPYDSLSTAFTIFRQVCSAVQYAHKQGVIHRDLKPLNIPFRKPRTGPEEAVLSDFGLAVQADASHHTFAHGGTLAYMAPEQFSGQAQPASDIFALGVTLYQLCTGSLPFAREVKHLDRVLTGTEPAPIQPSQLNSDLPPELDEPILRALERKPANRHRSAAAFWNELSAVLSDISFPSETRRHVDQAMLSQPMSQWTIKVADVNEEEDEVEEEERGSGTQAAPIIERSATQAQAPGPKAISLPAVATPPGPHLPQPPRAPRLAQREQKQFPRLLVTGGIAAGILALLAVLVLALPLLFISTATITLTPVSHLEQLSAVVTANQIHARPLSETSPTQSNTGNASGMIAATKAHGELEFLNNGSTSVTIPTMTFVGKSGVSITFQGPIVVPAINPPEATTTGFAVNSGANGNIPAFDLLQYCCAPNQQIQVRNPAAFTGGTDAQQNDQVQQSDIDHAAQPLIASQTQQEQTALQAQVQNNERVIPHSNSCQPTVNANNPVGTQAKTVTVSVSVTCTEEVYDLAAAQAFATMTLTQKAQQDVGSAYQLNGHVAIDVEETNTQILLNAQGVWAYAFTSARLKQLATVVSGKSQASARALLLQQPGIAGVQFSNVGMLPSVDHIQMKVQSPTRAISATVAQFLTPIVSIGPSRQKFVSRLTSAWTMRTGIGS